MMAILMYVVVVAGALALGWYPLDGFQVLIAAGGVIIAGGVLAMRS